VIGGPGQSVRFAPGIEFTTLADDELFAYLAVQGASSAWFRLKWITDFAALLRGKDASDIVRLFDHSQRVGAGRAAGQALLLANFLYGCALGPDLKARLEADRLTRWLVANAMRMLRGQADHRDPTDVRFGTVLIHLSQLALLPGWRFKLSEAWRQGRDKVTARSFRARGDAPA
ncbi:MAG: nucleotidyltransferase family protein, partial [Sphingomonas bacterium]|nr:nucleotidyltransferase family protein [Sphingomonas bacterium]